MILYINAPVCIYTAEKEYCTSVSLLPSEKVLKEQMGVPVALAAGGSEDAPCVRLPPESCLCWSHQLLQQ